MAADDLLLLTHVPADGHYHDGVIADAVDDALDTFPGDVMAVERRHHDGPPLGGRDRYDAVITDTNRAGTLPTPPRLGSTTPTTAFSVAAASSTAACGSRTTSSTSPRTSPTSSTSTPLPAPARSPTPHCRTSMAGRGTPSTSTTTLPGPPCINDDPPG